MQSASQFALPHIILADAPDARDEADALHALLDRGGGRLHDDAVVHKWRCQFRELYDSDAALSNVLFKNQGYDAGQRLPA